MSLIPPELNSYEFKSRLILILVVRDPPPSRELKELKEFKGFKELKEFNSEPDLNSYEINSPRIKFI